MQSPTDIEDSTEHDDDQRGDEHWRQDPDGRWRLDPEERKRRLQAAMEQGAADRLARAWDLVREAKREIDIALTYARDPELHKIGVGLGALLDEDTRDKSYAYVNKLVRGGTTTRRQHGTAKRDGELLLGAIRSKWDGSDEEMARFVIGIMPDLGLLEHSRHKRPLRFAGQAT
jgi:hypothetical protein